MGLEAWAWMGIWILVMAVLVWVLVREPRRSERDEAMEILRARLARGELTTEEFERARALLEAPRIQGRVQ
ncbi:MAG TPA: SHOCT domain-containing protein [Candidatus Binatus sp.]|nr:SHOCT domain-containing protein [Candidatus Binatus sp.]